ncbi:MAG: ferritin-like domain-containing protein [Myxococcaceae bacterium]|nr:ferritin-like domain-containing protein [Myxococcaceae bacterium]
MSRVALGAGNLEWRKVRRAQLARGRRALNDVPEASLQSSDEGRRFWSRRTWSELAAVPAVSQVVLALVREGAAVEALAAYTTIAQDEARHAALSRALAERLGGYDEDVPDGLDYEPARLARPSDAPYAVWALANGCFSETVSLELIRARHAATRHPVVRAVLAETLKDESLHVRVAWLTASEVLPNLSPTQRRELWDYGQALAEMARRTFATRGLPARLRRHEARLRDGAAAAGLGALPAAHEDALVDEALATITARLGRLGLGPAR